MAATSSEVVGICSQVGIVGLLAAAVVWSRYRSLFACTAITLTTVWAVVSIAVGDMVDGFFLTFVLGPFAVLEFLVVIAIPVAAILLASWLLSSIPSVVRDWRKFNPPEIRKLPPSPAAADYERKPVEQGAWR